MCGIFGKYKKASRLEEAFGIDFQYILIEHYYLNADIPVTSIPVINK